MHITKRVEHASTGGENITHAVRKRHTEAVTNKYPKLKQISYTEPGTRSEVQVSNAGTNIL